MTLETPFTARSYEAGADLNHVLAFRRAIATRVNSAEYPTVSDLHELLDPALPHATHTRLWEDAAGRLLGFAILQLPYGNLLFFVHPLARNSTVPGAIIAWAGEQLRGVGSVPGAPARLDSPARVDDSWRRALLEAQGFWRLPDETLRMARSLRGRLPAPQFPPGFVARPLAGEPEAGLYVALHQEAFGTTNMTITGRLAILRNPDYIPALDLIAVAPDGSAAGFCVCHINRAANRQTGRAEGEIGMIGTRPAFRSQGLGRAMLLTGLHALQAQGLDTAVLGTAVDNGAAQHVFAAAGFRVVSRVLWYAQEGG